MELIERIELIPHGHKCKLKDCPPGFFLFENEVCLKTEYGENDSYLDNGEVLWGGTNSEQTREKHIVQPLVVVITPESEVGDE